MLRGRRLRQLRQAQHLTLLTLIETLARVLDRPAHLNWFPAHPGDAPHTLAHLGKSATMLGYCPQVTFADGIQLFADWFLMQQSALHPSASPA